MVKKKLKEKEAGINMGKFPCFINDECGSSDACVVYKHVDDSYSAFCWSCEHSALNVDFDNLEVGASTTATKRQEERIYMTLPTQQEVNEDYIAVDNKERKIRADVYDFYGCKMEIGGDGETIDKIFYPTYRNEKEVGFRIRSRFTKDHSQAIKGKAKVGDLKCFDGYIGDTKKGIELFGQHLFSPEKHKRLFIVEGEEDAIAGYKMTDMKTKFDGGYAFTSVPSGANIIGLKSQLRYINSFDEIFLCFDNDKQGKELLDKAVKILPVGKVRLVKLPDGIKDISDLWRRGGRTTRRENAEILWRSIWSAEKYSPAGIYSMSEGWPSYLNRGKDILIPFPASFGDLNKKTFGGYGLSEITTLAAPSSVGKSSFVKEMIYTALAETSYNIGVMSFEETLDEFIEGLLSVHMSQQLNEISYDMRDREAEYKAFQELLKLGAVTEEDGSERITTDRIHFLDHQGSCDEEELLDKVNFLIDGLDCKIIILDPVTLALSNAGLDEDEFASKILKLTKRKGIAWINVHHVRKNAGGATANSEGGELSEEDIKGSGVWFQVSMNNILLTRNKVHENEVIRNTTTIKMSKCRRHGKSTGYAGWVYYNGETGRLELGMNPEETLLMMSDDFTDDGAMSPFGENEQKEVWDAA